ncbi:hypothetical protein ACQP1P_45810 [Dactylosporangium sp. CA-052675]|uniref:hypothetical protein n=1 Tax=Dactylosporangium sp. CA-052675 TaxID=3239927 RepID=UPI003D8E25A1
MDPAAAIIAIIGCLLALPGFAVAIREIRRERIRRSRGAFFAGLTAGVAGLTVSCMLSIGGPGGPGALSPPALSSAPTPTPTRSDTPASPSAFPTPGQGVSIAVTCALITQPGDDRNFRVSVNIVSRQPATVGVGVSLYDDSGEDLSTGAGDIDSLNIGAGETPLLLQPRAPQILRRRVEVRVELWPPNKIGQEGARLLGEAVCGVIQ